MRSILHCDLDCFFASVECVKNPSLRNVPMAVCGDPELRHGIILAKNQIAKSYGIYTPETVYSAKKKCPNLVLVKGNHIDYEKYSKLVNKIYLKYTDRVEPFGIDESFLDVTESRKLFGTPFEIANLIKEEVKSTLGLTVSIGVSFNKSLAKLGSDMKKPDGITCIPYENFKQIIYPLPVNTLLFVGKATNNIFKKMRIFTIGDLACYNKAKLIKKIGKSGVALHNMANGIDDSKVQKYDTYYRPKSFSKGTTFKEDLNSMEQIKNIIKHLTYDISKSLRKEKLKCSVVGISIKDNNFLVTNRQRQIDYTDLFPTILSNIIDVFENNYKEGKYIRAVTVFITGINKEEEDKQVSIFDLLECNDNKINEKMESLATTIDNMNNRIRI